MSRVVYPANKVHFFSSRQSYTTQGLEQTLFLKQLFFSLYRVKFNIAVTVLSSGDRIWCEVVSDLEEGSELIGSFLYHVENESPPPHSESPIPAPPLPPVQEEEPVKPEPPPAPASKRSRSPTNHGEHNVKISPCIYHLTLNTLNANVFAQDKYCLSFKFCYDYVFAQQYLMYRCSLWLLVWVQVQESE